MMRPPSAHARSVWGGSCQRTAREFGERLRIPRQSGRGFRFDVGHRSDLIPATIPK
jgi:hypothetical protein